MELLDFAWKHAVKIAPLLMFSVLSSTLSWAGKEAPDLTRYFFSGDGRITLFSEKNNLSFSGVYRRGHGGYDENALERISRVFDAPFDPSAMGLSLRLLEFIDYLEDRLGKGSGVTITSGYRKPAYNTMLRDRGNLAAKASLHQYGMAADLKIDGVNAETLWNSVKDLNFGGAGYYHGEMVHIDVGPARSWDESTSGVGTGISDDNKLIGIVTDYDIYRPGLPVTLRFIRMTAFPIHVNSEFSLIRKTNRDEDEKVLEFTPAFSTGRNESCAEFHNIDQMNHIEWVLPADLEPGMYRIRARFCDDAWPDMPPSVQSPGFEVRSLRQRLEHPR